jgi:hypothetical protein
VKANLKIYCYGCEQYLTTVLVDTADAADLLYAKITPLILAHRPDCPYYCDVSGRYITPEKALYLSGKQRHHATRGGATMTTCPYDPDDVADLDNYPFWVGGMCFVCRNYDCPHCANAPQPADAYPDQTPGPLPLS